VGTIRVAAIAEVTEAEGPGARYGLWVQGCSIRCPGCCNPRMFDPRGGRAIGVPDVVAAIARVRKRIEGVTFLGGEPFEQASALAEAARGARALGLSVVTFSGYTLEELEAHPAPAFRELLDATDLLVDGRYDASRPEQERRWAGSANQRFHFLTDRYAPGIERIHPGEPEGTVELRIAPGAKRPAGDAGVTAAGPAVT
jgi:anaerobic ribonucleoside-triphosphate reductase activating protein